MIKSNILLITAQNFNSGSKTITKNKTQCLTTFLAINK